METDWRNVLARRESLVGKGVTFVEGGLMRTGPLKAIWGMGDMIQLVFPWMIWYGKEMKTWNFINIRTRSVSRSVPVFVGNDERVRFEIPGVAGVDSAPFTLGELNMSVPEPKEVNGFPKSWERLLTWYPNLVLNPGMLDEAFNCMGRFDTRNRESFQLSAKTTMKDVLSVFRDTNAKEKFLWYYIQLATGEDVRGTLY